MNKIKCQLNKSKPHEVENHYQNYVGMEQSSQSMSIDQNRDRWICDTNKGNFSSTGKTGKWAGSRLSGRGGLRSKYGEGSVLLHQRQPTEITPVSGSQLLEACWSCEFVWQSYSNPTRLQCQAGTKVKDVSLQDHVIL